MDIQALNNLYDLIHLYVGDTYDYGDEISLAINEDGSQDYGKTVDHPSNIIDTWTISENDDKTARVNAWFVALNS